ncbi:DinB family protein [Sporosarcina sp. Marseille-Q4063]|uniref:DinB family protein n=1 Tax=Sporosarcina sp. Marseille-Q4063 TaxID=2810514 RepID=UPI001BB0A9EC|nr:DinB family protein [Sporosarcina sp. Marseille-Q4063]QUW22954.1 DinB family protein [Sporosarcina sp. Marseille-Q4063]
MKINDEAREKLLIEVNSLTDEDLNWKPAENRWSVRQVMEHLYLMEVSIAKTIKHQLSTGERKITSDKPIERTTNRSVRVEAPNFAQPGDAFAKLDELKSKLSASHSQLRDIAETITEEELAAKSYPHPVFGDMSLKQWIPFVGYHELRHVEQIKEIKELINNK